MSSRVVTVLPRLSASDRGGAHIEASCTTGTSPPAAALTLTPAARAALVRWAERAARAQYPGRAITVGLDDEGAT